MNNGYTYRDTVRHAHHGMTAIEYYTSMYGDYPERDWNKRFEHGEIYLEGRPARAHDALRAGNTLEYRRPPWEEPPVPNEIAVLHQDDDLMVFNKPTELPVLPGGGYLENTMLHIVRKRHGHELSPIHRLGRGTTGAIIFTRTPRAAAALSKAMRDGDMKKTYLALVQGIPDRDAFDVDAPIGLIPHPLLGKVYASHANGKPSISHVRVLARNPHRNNSLVEVTIPTGRPHQIRIHMAHAGYPLSGDPLYEVGGGIILPENEQDTAVPGDCGYTLHSWRIAFRHPADGAVMEIEAPPPKSLQTV